MRPGRTEKGEDEVIWQRFLAGLRALSPGAPVETALDDGPAVRPAGAEHARLAAPLPPEGAHALAEDMRSLAEGQALAKIGSWSFKPSSDERAWSAEMFRLFGYPVLDAVPATSEVLARVHPDDRRPLRQAMIDAIVGERFEQTFRLLDPGGELRWLHLIGHRDGPDRFIGTVQDVTERRHATEALREAEERFRITVDHAPIGVALVDLAPDHRGRLTSANEALAQLVGYSVAELRETSVGNLVHPDDRAALERDLALLATDEQARVQLEVRCLHRHGHIVWAVLSGATVPAGESERRCAVFHAMDIGERKRFEGQLQYLADHDALTGLFNRRRFEEELVRALAHAARYGTGGAVLMIDLDGFKSVNDTLGHSCGDELVTRVGGLLREALRETDTLARLGGDEFAVIAPEADLDEAMLIAGKLLGVLRASAVVLSEGRHARVTASIGVTTFDPSVRVSADELIVEADVAMYEAKERGKDQAAAFDRGPGSESSLRKRQSWVKQLRAASEDGRFELMAQPIPRIRDGAVERYELLLRMRAENDELIPPGTFLYIAERFDLIQQIDRWVFGEAVRLLRLHAEAGHDVSLSVNMSGKTIGDPRLLDDISELLTRAPVPRDRLVVEVTETAAIVNIEKARQFARRLRALGCKFALDDFGGGFASFYYLKHLEFDYLKIDGEFIRTLALSRTDQLVVKSIVDIAHGLGAQTIAEHVGSPVIVQRLRELGVDYGQGYYLGRPAAAETILPALTAD